MRKVEAVRGEEIGDRGEEIGVGFLLSVISKGGEIYIVRRYLSYLYQALMSVKYLPSSGTNVTLRPCSIRSWFEFLLTPHSLLLTKRNPC